MLVEECLGSCYKDLPQPEIVLSPADAELSYFLWMPGFKYQPRLQKKLSSLRSISSEGEVVAVDEVLGELVQSTELEKRFNALAHDGLISIREAGDLARELGSAPSQGDLLEIAATFGNELNLEQFKELMAVSVYREDSEQYLEKVLRQLAQQPESGAVSWERLAYVLSHYGEAMTAEELSEAHRQVFRGAGSMEAHALAAALKA